MVKNEHNDGTDIGSSILDDNVPKANFIKYATLGEIKMSSIMSLIFIDSSNRDLKFHPRRKTKNRQVIEQNDPRRQRRLPVQKSATGSQEHHDL